MEDHTKQEDPLEHITHSSSSVQRDVANNSDQIHLSCNWPHPTLQMEEAQCAQYSILLSLFCSAVTTGCEVCRVPREELNK